MESLIPADTEKRKSSSLLVDRIAIGKQESEKVGLWIKQAQEISKGFLALTKSDLLNFLIHEHKPELSIKELTQLKSNHYDPIRHINWITQALKSALASGDTEMVSRLQDEIKGIELSVVAQSRNYTSGDNSNDDPVTMLPKKSRQKRVKKTNDSPALDLAPTADLEADSLGK